MCENVNLKKKIHFITCQVSFEFLRVEMQWEMCWEASFDDELNLIYLFSDIFVL